MRKPSGAFSLYKDIPSVTLGIIRIQQRAFLYYDNMYYSEESRKIHSPHRGSGRSQGRQRITRTSVMLYLAVECDTFVLHSDQF